MTYEEVPWHLDPDERQLIPKSARRKIASTYQAAVPACISSASLSVPEALSARVSELLVGLARFDEEQAARGYDLPALLLRSESAASSQIERLTSSVRNVALAELTDDAPANARIAQGNVAAMRTALSLPPEVSKQRICAVHEALIAPTGETFGGQIRDEQVWVGGTPYSPHGALFVPPVPQRIDACLDDLVIFAQRDDVNAIAKAAIVHAQFETIHPFIDGNGRTGRVLLHRVLCQEGVLRRSTLPVSAGLLHDVDAYMAAIRAYQQGDPLPIVQSLVGALELALVIGQRVATAIDGVMEGWRASITERTGSAIWRLPQLLAERPVVTASLVAERLDITPRAATNLVKRACEYGMLRPLGSRRRGDFYQSDELLDLLEEISSMPGIRRVLASRP
ncbi:Fic family protein [Thermophilibacter sp.]